MKKKTNKKYCAKVQDKIKRRRYFFFFTYSTYSIFIHSWKVHSKNSAGLMSLFSTLQNNVVPHNISFASQNNTFRSTYYYFFFFSIILSKRLISSFCISRSIAWRGYIIYIRRANIDLIAVHNTPMNIFLFLFSVWSFYAEAFERFLHGMPSAAT